MPQKIPGGATLKFEVELLSFGPKGKKNEMTDDEKLVEMSFQASAKELFKQQKFVLIYIMNYCFRLRDNDSWRRWKRHYIVVAFEHGH